MFFKKNAPTEDLLDDLNEHGPVYRFFASFGTHFLKLTGLNLLFIVSNIPAMLLAFVYCLFFLPSINDVFIPENFVKYVSDIGLVGNSAINDVGTDAGYQLYYLIVVFCVMFLLGSTLVCIGPFQSGFATIYRNIARNRGVFFFSDIKDGVKENWKQSTIHMLISLAATALLLMGIAFYSNHFGRMGTAISVLFTVLLMFWIAISNFVHYLIVCIDLPLKKIYRNAFLFFLIKLIPCMGLIFLTAVLLLAVPCILLLTTTYFAYAIAVFYYLMIVFCFIQYAYAFMANEMVNGYMLAKNPEESEEE